MNMKKIITILLVAIILVGCSKNDAGVVVQPEEDQSTNVVLSESEFAIEEKTVVKLRNNLDIEGCNKLQAPNLKILCADSINYDLAIQNKNQEYCQKITDGSTKVECLSQTGITN